jgi:Flp pilus assembly protein TadG
MKTRSGILSPETGRRHRQRGVAAIEFAITVPLLLLLVLGVFEFGRIFFQYNTLTKATRDAARYLAATATLGSTDTIVIDATDLAETQNLVVYGNPAGTGPTLLPGLAPGDVSASCFGGGTTCPGVQHVLVTAQYSYQPVIGAVLPTFGLGGGDITLGISLTSSVVMRVL